MKVLLDTNVILDAIQDRVPFDVIAKKILLLGQCGEVQCYFTANAATDIFYLYSKSRGKQAAKAAVGLLLNTYGVVAVDREDCLRAYALPNGDFEDALAEVCAAKIGADYIVTRDEEFLAAATAAKAVAPDSFLKTVSPL